MKISLRCFISIVCVLTFHFNLVNAGSFYNSRGLGEKIYFSSAQSMGMGGSLIAVPDRFQINVLNPAGLVFLPLTRLSGHFIHEAIWHKTEFGDGFGKYTNLNGLSLAIPLTEEKLVTSLNIIPSSQFDYSYNISDSIDSYNYRKTISASGGLNKVSVGFGWAIKKYIYVGGYFHYDFGKLEQTWMVDYASDLFWDSNDRLTRKMWGMNWTGGLIIHPTTSLYLGAVYAGGYKLTYKDQIYNTTQNSSRIYLVDRSESPKNKLSIPELWGFGLTYVLKEKYSFSSDFLYQPWSKFKQQNDLLNDYNNIYRLGFGVEILPSSNMLAKYHQKMTYRAGFYYCQLDFQDKKGNNVTEYGISIGTGFPYYSSWGRIDVALRYGQRGDLSSNPVKENIFQIFITVIGGEKWFRRGN